MDGSCTVIWGGEEYRFCLVMKHLKEIQKVLIASRGVNIGPKTFLNDLQTFNAWPHEAREVLRQGLIGAGHSSDDVASILARHFDSFPPFESYLPAQAVFFAGTFGDPHDIVGKKAQAERTAKMEATAASSSPPSMEPGQPSDGPLDRSMN